MVAGEAKAMSDQPSRDCVEVALRLMAELKVEDSAGLVEFVERYMVGWNAPAAGINEAVGVLRDMIKACAVACVLDATLPK